MFQLLSPVGYNTGMRFQFSILTLLICTAVLAVVCAVSVSLDVHYDAYVPYHPHPDFVGGGFEEPEINRPPTGPEVIWRLIYWGLPAVAVTLFLLWLARRLIQQSRAETVITAPNPLN